MLYSLAAIDLAVEEHKEQNRRFERAERLGLYRQRTAQNPRRLTSLGNRFATLANTLRTRFGSRAKQHKTALHGVR